MKAYKTQERINITLGLEINFWYNILVIHERKKMISWASLKLKTTKILNFSFMNTLKRIKIQVTDWEKFLQSTYNEGLVFTMSNELLKLNSKKANT